MIYIAHRVNSIDELMGVPVEYGVEIDVRSDGSSIILGHDPGEHGNTLNDYCSFFRHKLVIINIKTEKIENLVVDILKKFNIDNYFFLDSSMSSVVKYSTIADRKFSGRVSEFESVDTIQLSSDLIEWVWVDCFTRFSLTPIIYSTLKNVLRKKICLTSPDLLGRPEDIFGHAELIKNLGLLPDAICTKLVNIPVWKENLLFDLKK